MKILIALTNPLPLIIHETLTLGFALASFGHEIQLELGNDVAQQLLANPDNALTKMLASLDLYDIPPAWISAEIYQQFFSILPDNLTSQMIQKPENFAEFDSRIFF